MMMVVVRQERERTNVLAMTAAQKKRVVGGGLLLLRPVLVMLWVGVGQERGQGTGAELEKHDDEMTAMKAMPLLFALHVWTTIIYA